MAQITWTLGAAAMFSPEELDCAARGGSWDRASQTCSVRPSLPADPPMVVRLGTVDADQMFADGFVYVNGKWIKADAAEAIAASSPAPAGAGPGRALSARVVEGGSVLGYTVPVAPPVLLPTYVGGRLGRLELASGLRPESGGTERWIMGDSDRRLVLG